MTKQEKIRKWLIGNGYCKKGSILAAHKLTLGGICANNYYDSLSLALDTCNPVIGIFTNEDTFIKIPDFEDDKNQLTDRERQIAKESFRQGYLACEGFQVSRNHIDLEVRRYLKTIEAKCE